MPNNLADLPLFPGPSRFGSHFLAEFWDCPMKWALSRIAPHPSGTGLGLEPEFTAKPLKIGQEVHTGLEWYYKGIHSKPILNIDDALEVARAENTANAGEYESPEVQEEVRAAVAKLLTDYHDHWTPDDLQVIRKANAPLVERDLEVNLGYRDYLYTARVDLIATLGVFEAIVVDHKTVDASRKGTLCRELDLSYQITGLIFLCHHLLPELKIDTACGNLLIKRAGKDKDKCERYFTSRDDADLEKFRLDVTATMERIDKALDVYHDLSELMEPYEAIAQAFAKQPGKDCAWCPFATLCSNPARAKDFAGGFRVRSPWENTEDGPT
jgi:hypothetical protein